MRAGTIQVGYYNCLSGGSLHASHYPQAVTRPVDGESFMLYLIIFGRNSDKNWVCLGHST